MALFRHFLILAWSALLRNRTQAALAMLGMTVGVGALVTSVALGRGAQDAIADQLRAAGANMIIVTAGNYQVKREQKGGGIDDNAWNGPRPDRNKEDQNKEYRNREDRNKVHALRASLRQSGGAVMPAVFSDSAPQTCSRQNPGGQSRGDFYFAHYEDDPMAVHDHPTAKQRLGDVMAGLGAAATLTRADADAIRKEVDGVESVASGVHENARIFIETPAGKKQWFTRLHGTEPGLAAIRTGWTFPHGTFITQKQTDNREQVVVLGRVVAERLFGSGVDPTGSTVTLWNQPFRVVGVVDSRSWATPPTPGDDQFDAIYVPVSTVHALLNLSKLNTITITAKSAGDTTRIAKDIVTLLRKRHDIKEKQADDFTVKTQAQQVIGAGLPPELAEAVTANMRGVDQLTLEKLASSLQRANGTMLALLASVAAVSLLVGGIGVMNLLLLSVTQRTREVGLRIALGAQRGDVALQFVLESVLLSAIGGLLGTVVGVLASSGLERFFKWSASVSLASAAMAIVVAMVLGVAFGVYPARRAAQLDPIEALRHE